MPLVDPSTGQPLAEDAIQRVLFIATTIHVYNIPPLTSIKGHNASTWTTDPSREIFNGRLRVVETSLETPSSELKVDVVLDDSSTGALFAAAPYTDPAVVEPVQDSSRFFALTVRDPQGRKATLGIGFEDRSEALDFSISLQEARRALGLDLRGDAQRAGGGGGAAKRESARDYSLKEGETITVNMGRKQGRRREQQVDGAGDEVAAPLQSFALPPPPGGSGEGGFALLPPPPSAEDVKRKRRSLRDLGFDDGQFGEFA